MKVLKARRTLISSIIAIVISFSLLIGVTFAWFTDTAQSGINKIKSGDLDVKIAYEGEELTKNTKIFLDGNGEEMIWEPGASTYGDFEIANDGSLALKFQFEIIYMNATETPSGKTLADVLSVYAVALEKETGADETMGDARLDALVVGEAVPGYDKDNAPKFSDGVAVEAFLLPQEAVSLEIGVFWNPTDNDNEFNVDGGLSIDFAVSLVATQADYEVGADGFIYDANATYPENPIIVDEGATGSISWTLSSTGVLTVSPSEFSIPDVNCGKTFAEGAWREAIVYNSNGEATQEGYNAAPGTSPDAGAYFCDRNAVTSLVIEEGVTSIGSFASQFPNLTGEVVIPASVTYIGHEALKDCKITKLTFAPGGTKALCIAPGALKNLQIEEIEFPADRPEVHIHCWALNNNRKLKTVKFPANVTTFSGFTHIDYYGMTFSNSNDSQILKGSNALEKIVFATQAVHNLFFNSAGNTSNINAIGGVESIIEENLI